MNKVMLIEDNKMNARLLEHVLTRDGFDVSIHNSAEEAIVLAAKLKPDIILMDIQLPGIDGLEATRQLKGDPATKAIPIIAITAHAMRGDEERILAAGCEGYISKPVDTRELTTRIRTYMVA